MENPTPKKSRKELQKQITELLNAYAKSMADIDSKKIRKSVKEASKLVAKAIAKSMKENKIKKQPSAAVRKNISKAKPSAIISSRRRAAKKRQTKKPKAHPGIKRTANKSIAASLPPKTGNDFPAIKNKTAE